MRRRRFDATSGLDLFLDAICNTFGGIVFISMLVVVMINSTSISSDEDPTDAPPVDAARIEELQREKTALTDEIRRQKEAAEILQGSPDLGDLVEQLKNAQAANRQLQGEIDDIEQRIDQTKDKTDKQKKLAALIDRLNKEIADRTERLSLPVEKSTTLEEKPFFLKGGKLGELRPDTVDTQPDGLLPKPTAGTPILKSTPPDAVEKVFSNCNPTAHYIAVVVWEDSCDRWPVIQKALRRKGFSYRLLLLPKDELVETGGSGGKVQ